MFEGFRSFSDYVHEYDLERIEGLLLRHLSSAYKVLAQTVPDGAKTETVREMEYYLRDMLKQLYAYEGQTVVASQPIFRQYLGHLSRQTSLV